MLKEDLKDLAITLAISAVIFIGLMYGLKKVDGYACQSTAIKMNKEYDYAFWRGCMIKVKGEWIRLERYTIISKRGDND